VRAEIKRNILLNPGPVTTTSSVKQALVVPDICPREVNFCELVRSVCQDLVRVVCGESSYEAVPFASSGTGAIDACISSVIPENAKILVVDNGAYGERIARISLTYYPKDRVIIHKISHTSRPDMDKLESLLTSHPEIHIVALVHHETTTGMLNPAPAILQIARRHGAGVILDAMSSYAGIPIDVRRDDYDFIVSSSNKCIQGMPGIGFVIGKRDRFLSLKDRLPKSYYLDLWQQYDFLKRTGQMQFTPPVQVFYALRKALDEFFEETQERRYARYAKSWEVLIGGLKELGFRMLLPQEHHSKILTAVFEPDDPAYSFEDMHDYLLERGITIYPGKTGAFKTFRIANIGAIDQNDIALFLNELRTYLKERRLLG